MNRGFFSVGVVVALSVSLLAPAMLKLGVADAAEPEPAFLPGVLDIPSGAVPENPTTLDFGPDDRLYVADRDGTIRVYEIERDGPADYLVVSSDTINAVHNLPNHNDNGEVPESPVDGRQVTGLVAVGGETKPVVYVSSSDPRFGGDPPGPSDDGDSNLDTNSGVISRLTLQPNGSWKHDVLVRGLPRSVELHATNGLQYDEDENVLYVAQGGNTNAGAPSAPFLELPEYALSAAILSIDLDHPQIDQPGDLPYDLPTIGSSPNPPFGGKNGDNQAKLLSNGPVDVYASGFRNPYDLVLTQSGEMYSVDNGANDGWGGIPAPSCTNAVVEGGPGVGDTLHRVTEDYYAGHPNPTRANRSFSGFPSAVPAGYSEPCEYLNPGDPGGSPGEPTDNPGPSDNPGLVVFPQQSINGITEYTASNFSGAMKGDLLTTQLQGHKIYRVQDPNGSVDPDSDVYDTTFSMQEGAPVDIVAEGDSGEFPGTVWVADLGNTTGDGGESRILVYEPTSSFCPSGLPPSNGDDADGDGFTNADEKDNDTNPCSPASFPPDADGDKESDLNDPDDDNDSLADTTDPFAYDNITSGTPATVPFRLSWDGTGDIAGGIAGTGFTGLMVNGSGYSNLFNQGPMTIGGAAGLLTLPATEGDAFGNGNDQHYAFQLGVDLPDDPILIEARIPTPLANSGLEDFQSAGIYIGPGNQSNFLRIAATANGGAGGVEVVKEVSDNPATVGAENVSLSGLDYIDLLIRLDPSTRTATAYSALPGQEPEPVAASVSIPSSWLGNPDGMAVGIIATSTGPGDVFGATYEHIEVSLNPDRTVPPPPPPPPGGDGDIFTDDNGSIFEGDIEWLAAAGITKGCNPPVNDEFCPDDFVTRGQMAAFFVRALGLSDDGGGDLFVDDDGSVFEGDIDRFGTEGITRGCNPPVNDRFCPQDNVTRGQMAAFFHRAAGLLGLSG